MGESYGFLLKAGLRLNPATHTHNSIPQQTSDNHTTSLAKASGVPGLRSPESSTELSVDSSLEAEKAGFSQLPSQSQETKKSPN